MDLELPDHLTNLEIATTFDGAGRQHALVRALHRTLQCPVMVSVWHRSENDHDLDALWEHEKRQLRRIAEIPDQDHLTTPIVDLGQTDRWYYSCAATENRQPFAIAPKQDLLGIPTLKKLSLWLNLKRLAQAIQLLHNQGVIHRSIGEWSVYTTEQTRGEMQLGGFEWSVRVKSLESAGQFNPKFQTFSFVSDWQDFARFALRRLDIDEAMLSGEPEQRIKSLTHKERQFLLPLLDAKSDDTAALLNPVQKIEKILEEFRRSSQSIGNAYALVVDCKYLTDSISKLVASGFIDNPTQGVVHRAIEQDLIDAKCTAINSRRLILQGRHLNYRIVKSEIDPKTHWEIASCTGIVPRTRAPNRYLSVQIPRKIQILSPTEAHKRMGSYQSWLDLAPVSTSTELSNKRQKLTYTALQLNLIVSLLLTYLEIWPVAIVNEKRLGKRRYEVRVVVISDPERNGIADGLGLGNLSSRVRGFFENSERAANQAWTFVSEGRVGELREHTRTWQFIGLETLENEPDHLVFESKDPVGARSELFLRPEEFEKQDGLIKRHKRILDHLYINTRFLDVLDEREVRTHLQPEALPVPNKFLHKLDIDKQRALKTLATHPSLSLIQGPPGVGKTHLISRFTQLMLENNPNSRILYTAQNHTSVNHLLTDIEANLRGMTPAPILVRSDTTPANESVPSVNDSRVESMLTAVIGSKAYAKAPRPLRMRIKNTRRRIRKGQVLRDVSYENLLVRAANCVFSTMNSRDVEQAFRGDEYFDWSIVDEASKATGLELSAVGSISAHRMLVGDHRQLPPFDVRRLQRILSDPVSLHTVISAGQEAFRPVFRYDDTRELLGTLERFGTDLTDLATRLVTLFETEFDPHRAMASSRAAKRLTLKKQYRMDPVIARLVSATYYRNRLGTHHSRVREAQTVNRTLRNAPLLNQPVTIVDMPFIGRALDRQFGEAGPNYHNPSERIAIEKCLEVITPSFSTPLETLAILTPYQQQAVRLTTQLAKAHGAFRKLFPVSERIPVHTVDSFQGQQADVVIVSLVRNNRRGLPRSLGFLLDRQRLNVLLSRAKHRLILVTSLQFLRDQTRTSRRGESEDIRTLRRLIKNIDRGIKEESIAREPYHVLMER